MKVVVDDIETDFRPWMPRMGLVFHKAFAFDCETTLIDGERPWLTPAYVLGAACDREQGFFLTRELVAAFFLAHEGIPVAMHNAPFDLDVIHVLTPETGI